nr:hypothetical protein [Texcoconibacillus texcoconensis]
MPYLDQPWETLSVKNQTEILTQWELIRGTIPEKIADIEMSIEDKQMELNQEEEFERSCALNDEVAEYASVINDLWIWYRTSPSVSKQFSSSSF